MSDYLVTINLPKYLEQWFVHRQGGTRPVKLDKNSMIAIALKQGLRKCPENYIPQIENGLKIEIPDYRDKNIRVYNHLSDRGKAAMVEVIRESFDLAMWTEIIKFTGAKSIMERVLENWMEDNGIEVDDTNFQTIKQKFYRMRAAVKRRKK